MPDRRINLAAARKHAEGARKRFGTYLQRMPMPKPLRDDVEWAIEMVEKMAGEIEQGRQNAQQAP